jgi:glutaredoxin
VTRVVVYGRKECHLCDEALAVVERVRREVGFDLTKIDVDGDPELVKMYGMEVPVVCVDGMKHAKFRVDEAAFRRRLEQGGSR